MVSSMVHKSAIRFKSDMRYRKSEEGENEEGENEEGENEEGEK
jgi:hypothetical protein